MTSIMSQIGVYCPRIPIGGKWECQGINRFFENSYESVYLIDFKIFRILLYHWESLNLLFKIVVNLKLRINAVFNSNTFKYWFKMIVKIWNNFNVSLLNMLFKITVNLKFRPLTDFVKNVIFNSNLSNLNSKWSLKFWSRPTRVSETPAPSWPTWAAPLSKSGWKLELQIARN